MPDECDGRVERFRTSTDFANRWDGIRRGRFVLILSNVSEVE